MTFNFTTPFDTVVVFLFGIIQGFVKFLLRMRICGFFQVTQKGRRDLQQYQNTDKLVQIALDGIKQRIEQGKINHMNPNGSKLFIDNGE